MMTWLDSILGTYTQLSGTEIATVNWSYIFSALIVLFSCIYFYKVIICLINKL